MNGPIVVGLLILFTLAVVYADRWVDWLMRDHIPMQWDETDTLPRMEQALTNHPATSEWLAKQGDPKYKRWTE
jgi:vancomycin permeability regulator SanA